MAPLPERYEPQRIESTWQKRWSDSGVFRSNMSTYHTETVEGEKGYRGVLRGPLANRERPSVRYVIDTESGDASVAASNPSWR